MASVFVRNPFDPFPLQFVLSSVVVGVDVAEVVVVGDVVVGVVVVGVVDGVEVSEVVVGTSIRPKHRFVHDPHEFGFANGTGSKYTVQIKVLYMLKPVHMS